jgi:glycyl-tRNA synthetase alpha chain
MSCYNFEYADIAMLTRHFNDFEQQANQCLVNDLIEPAYELVLKASHTFNLLDSRGALSVTERQQYILRVRNLAKQVAEKYYAQRSNN